MLLVEVSSCFQLDQQQLISIKVKLMLPWFTLVVQGIIYSGFKRILGCTRTWKLRYTFLKYHVFELSFCSEFPPRYQKLYSKFNPTLFLWATDFFLQKFLPSIGQSASPPVRQSVNLSIGICNPFLNFHWVPSLFNVYITTGDFMKKLSYLVAQGYIESPHWMSSHWTHLFYDINKSYKGLF